MKKPLKIKGSFKKYGGSGEIRRQFFLNLIPLIFRYKKMKKSVVGMGVGHFCMLINGTAGD